MTMCQLYDFLGGGATAKFQIAENFAGRLPLGDFFGVLGPLLRPKKPKKCTEIEQIRRGTSVGFDGGGVGQLGEKQKTFRGARNSHVARFANAGILRPRKVCVPPDDRQANLSDLPAVRITAPVIPRLW